MKMTFQPRRKKSVSRKKSKRKSEIISLMNQAASDCGLFYTLRLCSAQEFALDREHA